MAQNNFGNRPAGGDDRSDNNAVVTAIVVIIIVALAFFVGLLIAGGDDVLEPNNGFDIDLESGTNDTTPLPPPATPAPSQPAT